MEHNKEKNCLVCQNDENQIPLLEISYQGKKYYICPQHMPILIHNPDKLAGMLPGAENMEAG
jgi:hypothetical protein